MYIYKYIYLFKKLEKVTWNWYIYINLSISRNFLIFYNFSSFIILTRQKYVNKLLLSRINMKIINISYLYNYIYQYSQSLDIKYFFKYLVPHNNIFKVNVWNECEKNLRIFWKFVVNSLSRNNLNIIFHIIENVWQTYIKVGFDIHLESNIQFYVILIKSTLIRILLRLDLLLFVHHFYYLLTIY